MAWNAMLCLPVLLLYILVFMPPRSKLKVGGGGSGCFDILLDISRLHQCPVSGTSAVLWSAAAVTSPHKKLSGRIIYHRIVFLNFFSSDTCPCASFSLYHWPIMPIRYVALFYYQMICASKTCSQTQRKEKRGSYSSYQPLYFWSFVTWFFSKHTVDFFMILVNELIFFHIA